MNGPTKITEPSGSYSPLTPNGERTELCERLFRLQHWVDGYEAGSGKWVFSKEAIGEAIKMIEAIE
jgi:hypothetical protein